MRINTSILLLLLIVLTGKTAMALEEFGLTVRFRILDEKTKKPVESPVLRIVPKGGDAVAVTLGSDGVFVHKLALDKEFTIYISSPGFANQAISVSTKVPSAKSRMNHAFPVIDISLSRSENQKATEYRTTAGIIYKTGGFSYDSYSTYKIVNYDQPKETKPVTEPAPPVKSEKSQTPDIKLSEPKASEPKPPANVPGEDVIEKSKAEAEEKAVRDAAMEREELKKKEIAGSRDAKSENAVDVNIAAAEEEARIKEEERLKAEKRIALENATAAEAIRQNEEEKKQREAKRLKDQKDKEAVRDSRQIKHGTSNPYTEILNAFGKDKSPGRK